MKRLEKGLRLHADDIDALILRVVAGVREFYGDVRWKLPRWPDDAPERPCTLRDASGRVLTQIVGLKRGHAYASRARYSGWWIGVQRQGRRPAKQVGLRDEGEGVVQWAIAEALAAIADADAAVRADKLLAQLRDALPAVLKCRANVTREGALYELHWGGTYGEIKLAIEQLRALADKGRLGT